MKLESRTISTIDLVTRLTTRTNRMASTMTEETIHTGKANEDSIGRGEPKLGGMFDRRRPIRSIICRDCGDEGIQDNHREEEVIACPSCEDILYRRVGRGTSAI